jgi:predicted ester cyclase
MSVEQNKSVLSAAVEAWNADDGERYLELYDPSIAHHGVGPEPLDQAGDRGFYEMVWAAFPGSQLTIDDTLADGDKLALRFHLAGEHKGEFMGVPATGRPVVMNGHTILSFRDGRVVERWTTSDLLSLLTQLGAIPAPGG